MQQLVTGLENKIDLDSNSLSNNMQFLTFTVGNEEYGVDIMTVREIKGWTETTRLPNSPIFMRGVMNLRGLIIPIFDLRTRFGMGVTNANAKNVVIIISAGNRTIGILVDTVSDILNTNQESIQAAPATDNNDPQGKFVNGLINHDGRMVVLLDVEKLFDPNIFIPVEEVQNTAGEK